MAFYEKLYKPGLKCCICGNDIEKLRNDKGQVVWDQGNNAEPVAKGRCCNVCNTTRVLPTRIQRWQLSHPIRKK